MTASYIFGGTTGETPESLKRKRAIAEALLQQGGGTPKNVGEGIAAVGKALAFRMMMDKASTAEREGQSSWQGDLNDLFPDLNKGIGSTPYAGEGDPASAIAGIESGGRYDALGPVTRKGDRAYGKYQVMGANIPEWSREALGRELTPQEFLSNPQAQDAVFQKRFGTYADKYGPEGAARAWFAGEGGMNDTGRTDQLGTSVAEYGQRFADAVGSSPAQTQVAQNGEQLQSAIRLLANPWTPPHIVAVAEALLIQEMQKSDPTYQVGLEKSQLELEQLRNPAQKAPQVETFYDDKTGQEYKARWNPQTGQYERVGGLKAPSGTSLTVGPDGEVQFTQGGMKPLTESQSKDTVFVTRAAGTLPLIDTYGDALTSFGENVASRAPLVGNYMKTPEYQQAEQAGKEFLQAILRKDTGAAITKEETEEYGSVYLPRPGDSAPLLEQKKASRRRAIIAIQNGLSPTAVLALEKGGVPLLTPEVPRAEDEWQVIDGIRIRKKR